MSSLREAVRIALARKKVPAFRSDSTRDLAKQLGLAVPVSVRNLLGTLEHLAPASVTADSGPLSANFVHGSAYLFLQSDGAVAWGGKVRESGVVGDNFRVTVALLDVKDAAGNTLVFVHEDTLAGRPLPGVSDKEWNEPGASQLVADNWEQIKTTRFEFSLHVSTDPWQVVEVGGIAIAIVVVAIVGGKAALTCPEGEHWDCAWTTGNDRISGDPREPPAASATYGCVCVRN